MARDHTPITTVEEAKKIWDDFHKKYEVASKPIAQKKAPLTPTFFDINTQKKSQEHIEEAAIKIQRNWRKILAGKKIAARDRQDHPEYTKFLNKQPTAKRSLSLAKRKKLLNAINNTNWDNDIFTDKSLPELALGLYSHHQITYQQLCTILERHQTNEDYPITRNIPILDANGKFTTEADKIVSQLQIYNRLLTSAEREEFRILISQLPPSEQFFYCTTTNLMLDDQIFAETFVQNKIITRVDHSFIHLSSGVRDALGIAQIGLKDYVRTTPLLGKFDVEKIDSGVRKDERYAALNFPDTPAYASIHGWGNISGFIAHLHDIYHSVVMSCIPLEIRQANLNMVEVARNVSSFQKSKETWTLIDSEQIYTLSNMKKLANNPILNSKEMTHLFCKSLEHNKHQFVLSDQAGGLFFDDGNAGWGVTWFGAAVVFNMLKHPTAWRANSIDPIYLLPPFKRIYDQMKSISPFLQDPSLKVNLFKYEVYQQCLKKSNKKQFEKLSEFIDENRKFFDKELKFYKALNATNPKANTLTMHIGDQSLFTNNDNLLDKLNELMENQKNNLLSAQAKNEEFQKLFTFLHTTKKTMTASQAKFVVDMTTRYLKKHFSSKTNSLKMNFSKLFDNWSKGNKRDLLLKIFNSNLSDNTKLVVLSSILINLKNNNLASSLINVMRSEAQLPITQDEIANILTFKSMEILKEKGEEVTNNFLKGIFIQLMNNKFPAEEINKLELLNSEVSVVNKKLES